MGATKPPQYLAKGYTGIKYVPPPHRPPRTVHTLATMMAGTSEPEAVRTQEEVINRFVAENAFQTMGDILGVRRGVEYFVNEELFAGKFLRDEGEEETKAEVEVNAEGVEETKSEIEVDSGSDTDWDSESDNEAVQVMSPSKQTLVANVLRIQQEAPTARSTRSFNPELVGPYSPEAKSAMQTYAREFNKQQNL